VSPGVLRMPCRERSRRPIGSGRRGQSSLLKR
jgi:hypothetical protein